MSASLGFTLDNAFYLLLFLVSAVEKTRPHWQEYHIGQVDVSEVHGVP